MSSAMNSIKAHVHAQIRRVPISMPLPIMFQPENIVSFICTTVKLIGVDDLTPLTTPRDFMETHSRSRRTSSSTSSSRTTSNSTSSSTRNVRQVETPDQEMYCMDARQTDAFWSLDEDLQLDIHSLAAASHNHTLCCGCGGPHTFAQCPRLKTMVSANPTGAKRMIDTVRNSLGFANTENSSGASSTTSTQTQRSVSTAPGSSAHNTSSSRARTPPTSNRRTVRQLQQGEDTDDDATITQLDTDDEGTETDDSRDFM
jgi:hypothetical protein